MKMSRFFLFVCVGASVHCMDRQSMHVNTKQVSTCWRIPDNALAAGNVEPQKRHLGKKKLNAEKIRVVRRDSLIEGPVLQRSVKIDRGPISFENKFLSFLKKRRKK